MATPRTVPLFVLPMGIFPLTQEPLRVFEPRYKQMLDDCVLEESSFGYISTVNPPEGVGGWASEGRGGRAGGGEVRLEMLTENKNPALRMWGTNKQVARVHRLMHKWV